MLTTGHMAVFILLTSMRLNIWLADGMVPQCGGSARSVRVPAM